MAGWKKKAITAAIQLYYSEEVIKAIENAKTENEAIRILTTTRKRGN